MNDTICSNEEYQENLGFWNRAWNQVKTPYKQLPELDYLGKIPEALLALKSEPILDLGCGSGWLSIYLARQGFKPVGVDIAENALELGRVWAEAEKLQVEFSRQDITALKFPDAYFAAVLANSIFEHLTYNLALSTLARLKRLLKPDGLFIGCFDLVGTGPGEYYKLEDGSQIYTDKGRKGMLLRCFSNEELESLFSGDWEILELSTVTGGSRFLRARLIVDN